MGESVVGNQDLIYVLLTKSVGFFFIMNGTADLQINELNY